MADELYELTHTVENGEDNFEFDATEDASSVVVSPAQFKLTHTRDGNTDEFDFGNETPGPTPTGDLSNGTVTFTEAVTRDNITSGSTLSILFGKIKKWFSDLKTVAFSGSYNDLSDTPNIPAPANNATITFTQGGVTKGSIDLNQSNDETIALDAGGGGGSAPDVTGSATVDDNTGTPGVTVTTTGSGTQADPYNLAFAFTNLKGATGAQGATGPQGPQGIQGETGATGATGPQGPQGETGATGATGPQGPAGADGTDGADGADGVTPVITATATADATSSATPTVTVSKTGTDAAPNFAFAFSGLKGATGETGAQGPQGETGATGATGSTGPQGPAGPGVPTGGSAGQVLAKASGTDYDTEWVNAGGGGSFPYEVVEVNKSISGSLVQWGYSDYELGVTLPNTTDVPVAFAPMLAGSWQCVVSNLFYTPHVVTGKPVVKITIRNVSNATASVSSITGLLFYKHSS